MGWKGVLAQLGLHRFLHQLHDPLGPCPKPGPGTHCTILVSTLIFPLAFRE